MLDWKEEVIPHPKDKTREIFKYYEFVVRGIAFRYFYDRPLHSSSTEMKDKKLYCVGCKTCWGPKSLDAKDSHQCPKGGSLDKLADQPEDVKVKRFVASFEKKPNQQQALSLLIIDSNAPYSLADSQYVPKFLEAGKCPKVETFYDTKVTESVKEMGWEKAKIDAQYCVEVGARCAAIDSVDIGNEHYTIAAIHNALQLRHYCQDHPEVKMEDIDPVLKPILFAITPDVSNAESFCSLAYYLMDKFAEIGLVLKMIIGDGLPVQHYTLHLSIKEGNLRSICPDLKGLPQYHLCLFHTAGLIVTHVRVANSVFVAFHQRMKRILKILRLSFLHIYYQICIEVFSLAVIIQYIYMYLVFFAYLIFVHLFLSEKNLFKSTSMPKFAPC